LERRSGQDAHATRDAETLTNQTSVVHHICCNL
jgi:hypothetical protein